MVCPMSFSIIMVCSVFPQVMECVNAGSASVMLTTRAAHATVLWTNPPAWQRMDRSAMAEGAVNVGAANAPTPSFRGPPVNCVPPAQGCVLNTSMYKDTHAHPVVSY